MNVSAALTREHQEIDAGVEAFVASLEHGSVDPAPMRQSIAALKRHIYLEEQFLFPAVREAGEFMSVLVMLREHGALWQLMQDVLELLDNPEVLDNRDSPDPLTALTTASREMLTQLDQHNRKEEPIIYPHADSALTEQATVALRVFLADGTTPEGWVCEAAR